MDQANTPTRREFLGTGLMTGLGLAGLGAVANAQDADGAASQPNDAAKKLTDILYPGAVDSLGEYVLPPLPYDYDALEPHIDAETMTLHHDKHHAGYVRGLKAAEAAIAEARKSGDLSGIEHLTQKSAFHGAGHFLHCIFWANMTPKETKPSQSLMRTINRDFDSMEGFEQQFFNASKSVEGSGWGILAYSVPASKLVVLQARNHQHATQWGNIPLLVVDVWEHAYYKKYSNMRGDYINAFMNVINWEDVSQRYETIRELLG